MGHAELRLKKNEDRRLRAGHAWIFSNEIDSEACRLTDFEPGQLVNVLAQGGKPMGTAYVNPHSLIGGRMISRQTDVELDKSLIKHRLNIAHGLRKKLYGEGACRLVFGEADGLPGLVVERFGDVYAVQASTAGMDVRRDEVYQAIEELYQPSAIVSRNDNPVRKLENLPVESPETVFGALDGLVEIEEAGLRFSLDPLGGQKTGWFFDQRPLRERLPAYVDKGARVLDLYSYLGAWGLRAAHAGADEVLCVDSSEAAIAGIQRNAELNGLSVNTLEGDVMAVLKELRQNGEKFDVIVCDPPALIKRRKDIKQGKKAYRQLNQAALQVLAKDGILVSASCSAHMPRDELIRTVQASARHVDRAAQLLEIGGQGPDHPIHPAIPETAYLKTAFFRVLPSW
ncbi:class I SAM-dependent rRNA methyltransferase [Natronospira bacteriovora]|uniref:Class I SAM-dependent rRNA methyltransferase n=1 Tax=Natronospira bacteriovora TaxID=3069753 RepID=A0ABU0WBY7_9GAMM|nr:class I SAM-dependent rRNA methyltransferase [Natronospira sp. AB-CW4]MDQ2070455.1 class I SAM-dependent rRNA methyltransferase [Natronospira sp. AB-CW4]